MELDPQDPIARKLWQSIFNLSKDEDLDAYLGKREEFITHKNYTKPGGNTSKEFQGQVLKWGVDYANKHELANYESKDMMESDDPIVMNFLKQLGLDPDVVERAIIYVENNKPVKINVDMYTCVETRVGSPWRSQ